MVDALSAAVVSVDWVSSARGGEIGHQCLMGFNSGGNGAATHSTSSGRMAGRQRPRLGCSAG